MALNNTPHTENTQDGGKPTKGLVGHALRRCFGGLRTTCGWEHSINEHIRAKTTVFQRHQHRFGADGRGSWASTESRGHLAAKEKRTTSGPYRSHCKRFRLGFRQLSPEVDDHLTVLSSVARGKSISVERTFFYHGREKCAERGKEKSILSSDAGSTTPCALEVFLSEW